MIFYEPLRVERIGRTDVSLLDHPPDLSLNEASNGSEVMDATHEDLFWYKLTIGHRQIDVLSCPKDDALSGLDIARHSPQPQSHVERIDAECGPEGKLADPVLFCMAGGAQRNGVAIARLPPYTTIGSCPHMRGVRWRCFAAGDTGSWRTKARCCPPKQVRLGLGRLLVLGMREMGIALRNRRSVVVHDGLRWCGPS